MDSAPAQIYQSPPILYIFSVFSAMAIVVAILRWLWLMRNDDPAVGSLNIQLLWGQVYIILAVTLFSLLLTIYVFIVDSTAQGTIIPETVILLGGGYFFSRHYKRHGLPVAKGLLRELGKTALWVLACVVGWGLTVAVGFTVYYLVVFLSRNNFDYTLFAMMVTGFLWNAPTIGLHRYIIKKYEGAKTLKGFKVYNLLMPVAGAYLILMLPLALQDAANSPKFQKAKYEKPLRKI